MTESRRGIETIVHCLTEPTPRFETVEALGAIPISAMQDIQWLIDYTERPALYEAFRRIQGDKTYAEGL